MMEFLGGPEVVFLSGGGGKKREGGFTEKIMGMKGIEFLGLSCVCCCCYCYWRSGVVECVAV